MKVKRYDYAKQFGDAPAELFTELQQMVLQGRYILSDEVVAFERAFAKWIGARNCVGVNSGTDALILAFRALGIGAGDEVITQANTFYATVAAICLVGATPVLVDADPRTFQMDVNQLESAITPRTKAIAPVHLYGKPAQMAPILDIARGHGVRVVEDAAQSHGATYNGQRVGTLGDIGCFSFHPSKNLAAAGDGGAVVTADDALADRMRVLRSLGQREQNKHVALGLNSKLDAIQAKILSWKLPALDGWNASRREIASAYRARLSGLPVYFQSEDADEQHVYHLMQLGCARRDALLGHLLQSGIDAVVRYPEPIHLQEAFSSFGWRKGQFPNAEKLATELLALPIRPDMALEEVDYVCGLVREFFGPGFRP